MKLKNDDILLGGKLQRFEAKFDGFQNTMMEELRKLQMNGNQRSGMENWNLDHPERYSNFCRIYIKFQVYGKWPWTWGRIFETLY